MGDVRASERDVYMTLLSVGSLAALSPEVIKYANLGPEDKSTSVAQVSE